MAQVRYAGGIGELSGSIAGNTFARNRSGFYVRHRTKPINPNSALQVIVRSALAFLTARWSATLTAPQRAAWNLYASSVAMKNRLGESIYLTGFNHYIRSNMIAKQLAETIVDAGPVIFELPAKDPTLAVTASEATQQLTVSYDILAGWAGEDGGHIYAFQGSPQNAQRNFFGGPWRIAGYNIGADPGPPAMPAVWTAPFAIAEGQRQWIYARVRRADGRLSEPFYADCFTAA